MAMASPHVLYYCPCNQTASHGASSSSSSSSQRYKSTLASPPPGLPASSPASRYAFHPLDSLYFCDECDQIRCNRCVTVDISSYYCPNCLFEVPGASVKAEKNRCARNCFECPCCQHTLSVLASDLPTDIARSVDPTEPAASQGEPPYYLGCSFCRWDSKSIGLVFEKPTGLSLQLQRSEDNASDVLEFDRLKDHFDPYLKTQTQAAITSAAVGSGSASRSRSTAASSVPTALSSSSNAATSGRSARANAARNAAAAALQSSKLVRDLPHLAHSKHLAASGLPASGRSGPIEPDELKRYRALNPWQPPSDSRSSSNGQASPSMGVVAKREKHRRDYIARLQNAPNQPFSSLEDKISSLEQRWSSVSIADQPVRAADLRPTRVPLKSKLTKRCPACRHIVIKPDIKAASNRFKIKLVALNFLPEIHISLAPQQPYLDSLRFRSGGAGSTLGSLRRRPPSMLVSQSVAAGSDPLGSGSSIFVTSNDVDFNALIAGQTYSFQITITNPLDDPVQVDMSFVRFADPSRSHHSQSERDHGRNGSVQPLPEPKYISSAGPSTNAPGVPGSTEGTQLPEQHIAEVATRPRLGWQVYPSATSVSLNAFNEVWELEDSEDLYSTRNESNAGRNVDAYNNADSSQRRIAVKTAVARNADGIESSEESVWVYEDEEDDKDDNTYRQSQSSASSLQRRPFLQKGHTTSLYLDLALSSKDPPAPGPLELAMHVTYRYTASAGQGNDAASAAAGKDFSFWTSIRLGTVIATDG
ncbi:hypothetical protein NDA16_001984 [Ustilago loliicola]|nr:hypothetical protein NDA16_001984 [Ustilago loliicola]